MANNKNSSGPRQAVVLIHGIGEQRPTETLRGFVDAFLEPGGYHSKPDLLSATYEMRRLKLRKLESSDPKVASINPDWPETDFYEYYWAHQMYGTTIAHIMSWLWRILIQGIGVLFEEDTKKRVHPRLRWLVPGVWLVVLAGIAAAVIFAVKQLTEPSALTVGMGVALVTVVWGILRGPLLGKLADIAGDAARYFDINPKNISRRYDIIRGGIDILRKLHTDHDERGDEVNYRYGRIVLMGHSLGSVIAYDILRHYWQEVNGKIEVDPAELAAVECFEGDNGNAPPDGLPPHRNDVKFRGDQYAAWLYLNRKKTAGVTVPFNKDRDPSHDARWLISDFVTLGCPMTYAPLLMAKSVEDVTSKIALRELPTCPPDRSKNLNPGRYTVLLSAELERIKDFHILPQSAQFATVRWTNFYFHNDPIGGPLGAIFGKGIDDQRLLEQTQARGRAALRGASREDPQEPALIRTYIAVCCRWY